MSEPTNPSIPAPLLAELGHELRTPLSAIIGFSDAMRAQAFGPLSDQYTEHAGLIYAAGRHMLDLIEAMTGAATGVRGRTLFDAREAVREAAGMIPADGIVLILAPSPAPAMIRADALAVRQILINLAANARKAVAVGGRVTLGAAREGGHVVLRVEDNGPGLPPADAQGAGQGLGRGLALARAFAHAQGGEIELLSTPGAGVTAIVRLPAAES